MHISSQYKERFIPSNQSDMLTIVESDKKLFQEYKKTFNREEVEGICRHLCDYVILNNLLIDKETFSKAFEDKSLLIRNLIERVHSSDITACEEYRQRSFTSNRYLERAKKQTELKNRQDKIINCVKINSIPASEGIVLMEKLIKEAEDYNELPSLYKIMLKKPKVLTVADLRSLSVIDGDNNYKKISFGTHDWKKKNRHALLIKKNSDNNFAFYDPNYGAVFDLTNEELCELITKTFYSYKNTTMLNTVAKLFLSTAMIIHNILLGPLIPATLLVLYCSRLTSQEYDVIGDTNIDLYKLGYGEELNEHQSLSKTIIKDVHVQSIISISQTSAK